MLGFGIAVIKANKENPKMKNTSKESSLLLLISLPIISKNVTYTNVPVDKAIRIAETTLLVSLFKELITMKPSIIPIGEEIAKINLKI